MDERQAARIGAQVRQARKRNALTVHDLAEKAGVAPNTVTRVELGRSVRPGNLRAILDALRIDPMADSDDVAQDVELAQSVISQWLRHQPETRRREMIGRLMRMVADDGDVPKP